MTEQTPNYVYSDTQVSTSAAGMTPSASVPQIVAIADQIWMHVLNSKIPKSDNRACDALLTKLQSEYKDFNASFPIALRWMVQAREYNKSAFKKYLIKHSTANLDSREGFIRLQAEYLVLLFRSRYTHPDEKMVAKRRNEIVKQLLDEDNQFLEDKKQIDQEIADEHARIAAERKQILYQMLLRAKNK
jgi:hypothetical protein